jgi:chorismate-pyruvate lyase
MTEVRPAGAPEVRAALSSSRGTVTEFLEGLAGERIDADIISQWTEPAGDDNPLGLRPDAELLRRAVLLIGRTSGRAFVYAESTIALGRLPDGVRHRLEQSHDPIGRVLLDHHLRIRREPLAGTFVAAPIEGEIAALLRASALSRRYRIRIVDEPAIVVSEWFLGAVTEALTSKIRPPTGPDPTPDA